VAAALVEEPSAVREGGGPEHPGAADAAVPASGLSADPAADAADCQARRTQRPHVRPPQQPQHPRAGVALSELLF